MKKKSLIWIGIIMIVYLGVSFLINYLFNINKMYIVFPDNINLKYEENWKLFSDDKTLNNIYQIVDKGNIVQSGKLTLKDEIISSDDLELENDMIAYRGSRISSVIYQNEELQESDYQYLMGVLKNKNITIDVKQIINKKYIIDLNNDGLEETIYAISNNYDVELGKLFSAVILKENNEWIEYDEFSSEYDSYVPCIYFVDLYKDKQVDMIIKNIYSSLTGQDVKLFSFDNNLFYKSIFEEGKR